VGRACMPSGRMTVEWRRSHSSSCCSGAPQNTTDTNELNTTPAPYSQQMAGNAYRITCTRRALPAQAAAARGAFPAAAHGAAVPTASATLLALAAGARRCRDRPRRALQGAGRCPSPAGRRGPRRGARAGTPWTRGG